MLLAMTNREKVADPEGEKGEMFAFRTIQIV
jgi:hypothetical protein